MQGAGTHGGLSDATEGKHVRCSASSRATDWNGMVRWKAHSQGHTAAYVPRAGIDDIARTPTNTVPFKAIKVDVDF